MPKINIDELCEPIEVTVGGKTYKLEDISRETAKKMTKIGGEADDIQMAIEEATKHIRDAKTIGGDANVLKKATDELASLRKKAEDSDSAKEMAIIMTEILGAEEADIAKLGMRKLMMLVTKVMGIVNEEMEAKNAPKAAVMK